jgi:hypothetical protein
LIERTDLQFYSFTGLRGGGVPSRLDLFPASYLRQSRYTRHPANLNGPKGPFRVPEVFRTKPELLPVLRVQWGRTSILSFHLYCGKTGRYKMRKRTHFSRIHEDSTITKTKAAGCEKCGADSCNDFEGGAHDWIRGSTVETIPGSQVAASQASGRPALFRGPQDTRRHARTELVLLLTDRHAGSVQRDRESWGSLTR